MKGFILYEGPSRIDGKPIVAIATGFAGSANPKTGPMIQTYFINADIAPLDAIRCGKNDSICGSCPLKKKLNGDKMEGGCYVNVGQGPTSVYKAYLQGSYPKLTSYDVFKARAVRLGTYGEPTAIPLEVIAEMLSKASMWTGYTHRWMRPENQDYKKYCVASCDSVAQVLKASELGWDTFRHKSEASTALENETLCLNESTGIQCIQCGLCNGQSKKNIVITRHGPTAMHFKGD